MSEPEIDYPQLLAAYASHIFPMQRPHYGMAVGEYQTAVALWALHDALADLAKRQAYERLREMEDELGEEL